MAFPTAYFITWTTYGTRLHGDVRGTVDRQHNQFGSPVLTPNQSRESFERVELLHEAIRLDTRQRRVTAEAICEHAAFKAWHVLAINARTNHVHVVVAADAPPERVMNAMKAYATRRLRERRLVPATARLWTRHGSTRYLWNGVGVAEAVDYVDRVQDLKG